MQTSEEWTEEQATKNWPFIRITLWGVFWGGMTLGFLVLHYCIVSPSSFDTRMESLKEFQEEFTYDNPDDDRSLLLKHDIPLRKIVYQFPRPGTAYSAGNIAAINATITDQIEMNAQLKKNSMVAEGIILFLLCIQLGVFVIACHYTILTGRLIPSDFQKKILEHMSFSEMHYENVASHIAKHSTSILLTIGIGGTFLGLLVGLNNSVEGGGAGFNVTALLHGLKVSFTSTLAGVLLSLLVRLVQQAFAGPSETIESLVDKVDELRGDIEGAVYNKVLEATIGHHNGAFNVVRECGAEMRQCVLQLQLITSELSASSRMMTDYKTELDKVSGLLSTIAADTESYKESVKDINNIITRTQRPLEAIEETINSLQGINKWQLTNLTGAIGNLQKKIEELLTAMGDKE